MFELATPLRLLLHSKRINLGNYRMRGGDVQTNGQRQRCITFIGPFNVVRGRRAENHMSHIVLLQTELLIRNDRGCGIVFPLETVVHLRLPEIHSSCGKIYDGR